jgi:hypothetical protein
LIRGHTPAAVHPGWYSAAIIKADPFAAVYQAEHISQTNICRYMLACIYSALYLFHSITQKSLPMMYTIAVLSIVALAWLASRGLQSGDDISKY